MALVVMLVVALITVPVHGSSTDNGAAAGHRSASSSAAEVASGAEVAAGAEAAVEVSAATRVIIDEGGGGDGRRMLLGEDLHQVAKDLLGHIKRVAAAATAAEGTCVADAQVNILVRDGTMHPRGCVV